MLRRKILGLLLLPYVLFSLAPNPSEAKDSQRPTGAIVFSIEDENKMIRKQKLKTVRGVKLNALGIKRLNEERQKKGEVLLSTSLSAPQGEETLFGSVAGSTAVPSAVDNSLLSAIPPIGDQLNQFACTAFATSFAVTHNTALVMGWDPKQDSSRRCSPAFVYDHTKFGSGCSSGSHNLNALEFIESHGCVSETFLPYNDNSCTRRVTDAALWKGALKYRTEKAQVLNILTGITTDMTDAEKDALFLSNFSVVKGVLANGYVVPMTLRAGQPYYDYYQRALGTSFPHTALIQPVPGKSSAFQGLPALYATDLEAMAHAVALVGYDDNAWVDANQNGAVDDGELGVIKFANSWGKDWGIQGYGYATYRDVRKKSVYRWYHSISRAKSGALYEPRVVAEGSFAFVNGQSQLQTGFSDATASLPPLKSSFFTTSTTLQVSSDPAAVVFDLSDHLVSYSGTRARFHTLLSDTAMDGQLSRVRSLKVLDAKSGQVLGSTASSIARDGPESGQGALFVEFDVPGNTTPSPSPSPSPSPTMTSTPSPSPTVTTTPSPSPSPSPKATSKPCKGRNCR